MTLRDPFDFFPPKFDATSRTGFQVENVSEYSPDEAFAQAFPRAERYNGWPMLVLLELRHAD
ncbi:hypothetical protein [Blastopirellula marina]|nr:hypothetical protein [Blastopirellula marina]